MNSEQKKLILVAVLLVAAGGVYFWFGRPKSPLPNKIAFVCVETGKIYKLDRDDVPKFMPATNPDTGQATLLPAYQDEENGKFYASQHYAYLLREPQLAEVNKYVDPQTLEILESPR
jgi:hypothetical protein